MSNGVEQSNLLVHPVGELVPVGWVFALRHIGMTMQLLVVAEFVEYLVPVE